MVISTCNAQNKHTHSENGEWGCGKEILDYSKTESYQEQHLLRFYI